MAVNVVCKCGKKLAFQDSDLGSKSACPSCGAPLSVGRPVDARDVFISYAFADQRVANVVRAALEARKISCWIAPRDIVAGTSFAEAIVGGIEACRSVVLILTSTSNVAPAVHNEITTAFNKRQPIVPFMIHDVTLHKTLEFLLGAAHRLSASNPPRPSQLDELARAVRQMLSQVHVSSASDPPVWASATEHDLGNSNEPASNEKTNHRRTVWVVAGAAVLLAAVIVSVMVFSSMTGGTALTPAREGKMSEAIERSPPEGLDIAPQDADIKTFQEALDRAAQYAQGREIQRAISCMGRAIQLNPRSDLAYGNRGLLLLESGKFDRAIEDLTEAIELNGNSNLAFYFRGVAYHKRLEYNRALSDYERASDLGFSNPPLPEFIELARAKQPIPH